MRYVAQTVFRDDDLMHFGVKGMKWGVRNSKHYISKMNNAKTRLGKAYYNRRAANKEYNENIMRSVKSSKGIMKKMGSLYGYGEVAARNNALANYHTRAAGYSKTRFGKHYNNVYAFNAKQNAKDAQRVHDSNSLKGRYNAHVKNFNTTRQSLTGRKFQKGKELLYDTPTFGYYTVVKDAAYLPRKRKK